ncbi:hypothetical protein B0181_01515 [Moraxella caviae]|uniref:site-specific DNA-methyltransferase (adenine-specific) n=1 Tax=Moraxella caviae TaxID=34060 RepID=A0A1T0AAV1_9GAMM|nr:class I SAM-dependent DNA methyltransferase [Moraxella caviae]OOR92835.1 hypothetical protein B0181_01515 [Moraxella caviae]
MPTANSRQSSADLHARYEQAFLAELDKKLWDAADRLRTSVDAAVYKYPVLGLVFLKYVSDSFTACQEAIKAELTDPNSDYYLDPADFDEQSYQDEIDAELADQDNYTARNVFWVKDIARYDTIQKIARYQLGQPYTVDGKEAKFGGVAKLIDDAFEAIITDNPALKGVLPNISALNIEPDILTGLIDLFADTNFNKPIHNGMTLDLSSKDILGHVYEYFLGQFAAAEGKKAGQFFTPKSIVSLIVEMLEPLAGRVYDPAMGAGGFFVQSEKFIKAHQGNLDHISIYGQEQSHTTYNLAVMNMALRGIPFNFAQGDTLKSPAHRDIKMDYIMANPPFNVKQWYDESLQFDKRWAYGLPSAGNANFAWLSHMIAQLSDKGRIAMVLANGSMSTQTKGEGNIRAKIVDADLVECMLALPSNLFTNVTIPACVWFLNKNKTAATRGKVLFIDARNLGYMKDRVLRDFTQDDKDTISQTYHNWQKGENYTDTKGFCYSATLDEIAANDYVLTAGRYVGAEDVVGDDTPFAEKMQQLTALLYEQFAQSAELEEKIKENLGGLGYEA